MTRLREENAADTSSREVATHDRGEFANVSDQRRLDYALYPTQVNADCYIFHAAL